MDGTVSPKYPISGDDRGAWIAFWSGASAMATIGFASVGIGGPYAILVPLAFGLTSLAGYLIYGPKIEQDLNKWLDRNYFGKESDFDSSSISDPMEIGFEWSGSWEENYVLNFVPQPMKSKLEKLVKTREGIGSQSQQSIFRQIRSLYSILHPIGLSAKPVENHNNDGYQLLNIELNRPGIPPANFFLRLRFFTYRGREVTNPIRSDDPNASPPEGSINWYWIPVVIEASNPIRTEWETSEETWWFVSDNLQLNTSDNQQSILRSIESYTVTIRLKSSAIINHHFVQAQVFSMLKKGNTVSVSPLEELSTRLFSDPNIVSTMAPTGLKLQ